MSGELIRTTYLQLTALPENAALGPPVAGLSVTREQLASAAYLALFQAVGGPLGWDGRINMTEAALTAFLEAPSTDNFVLKYDGVSVGFCEFDASQAPDSELVYFGLIPGMQGKKLGPYLLDAALRKHWQSRHPGRVWLHTDTWDDPKAIGLYLKAGFHVFAEHMLRDDATYKDYKAAIGLMH